MEPARNSIDAYGPAEIAHLVEQVGVKKAGLPVLETLVLGLLAGAFISFGAMFYTLVVTDSGLGWGLTRFLGGIAFSLGLVLVVVAGAELFTGNNLIIMAWAGGRVSTMQVLRNWGLVYVANFVGCLGSVVLVVLAGTLSIGDGAMAQTAAAIAKGKIELSFVEAFARGVLCNALVCLAVWLCFAAHSVSGKILAIVFPISAFVALGFEHSVANMYLIPIGMFAGSGQLDIAGLFGNLIPVTLGNIVGGSVLVALTYWTIYLRHQQD